MTEFFSSLTPGKKSKYLFLKIRILTCCWKLERSISLCPHVEEILYFRLIFPPTPETRLKRCHLYPESSRFKTFKFSFETAFLVLLSHLVFPFFPLHQVLVILPMVFFVLSADPKVLHKIHTEGLPWRSSG